MSTREATRVFGLHRDTVRKMLEYFVPPGYRPQSPPRRPKLDPYRGSRSSARRDSPAPCWTASLTVFTSLR